MVSYQVVKRHQRSRPTSILEEKKKKMFTIEIKKEQYKNVGFTNESLLVGFLQKIL